MGHHDQDNYCPCGKLWPCRCPKACKVMGFHKTPKPGDDAWVVEIVECSRCGQNVLLEIDPNLVEGAVLEDGRWVVDDAGGPAIGECCGLLYASQPDGQINSFVIPEKEEKEKPDVDPQ